MPRVSGRIHGGKSQGGGPTVGLHQLALDVHVGGGVRLSQGCFEGGDVVELDSGEAACEAWGVVFVNFLVDLPRF